MSDTRPPITAGPIERAFKFLNSTSVTCIGLGEGLGVGEGDGTSCAGKGEKTETTKAQKIENRAVISRRH
jgi:hypothetical protein